jgi:hypothetical protein
MMNSHKKECRTKFYADPLAPLNKEKKLMETEALPHAI